MHCLLVLIKFIIHYCSLLSCFSSSSRIKVCILHITHSQNCTPFFSTSQPNNANFDFFTVLSFKVISRWKLQLSKLSQKSHVNWYLEELNKKFLETFVRLRAINQFKNRKSNSFITVSNVKSIQPCNRSIHSTTVQWTDPTFSIKHY
jgi:hypothetical protein